MLISLVTGRSAREAASNCHNAQQEIAMRNYLLATTALLMISAPAVAKDQSGYVGGDIGIVWPNSQDLHATANFTTLTVPAVEESDFGSLKYKSGIDVDLIGGYDFGMFRLEGELGYKPGKVKRGEFSEE